VPLYPGFRAASKAAERWLNTVALIAHFGRGGGVHPLYELLMPTEGLRYNLHDSYNQHAEVLGQMKDKLAVLSDSSVAWEHGRGRSGVARVPACTYPHVWSSAHEAAQGIAQLTLEMLVWPLAGVNDAVERWDLASQLLARCWKALAMPLDEVAALQERIRRERAKLLQAEGIGSPEARNGGRPAKRRIGRPKKTEKDSATKVIAVLSKWHGYEDGSVTNLEPATNRGLADGKFGLSANALTRFLANRGGYKRYASACHQRSVGSLLMLWRGELPDRHARLLPHESGREGD
jgi:hypothetical protein